jgi:hypothetical protein
MFPDDPIDSRSKRAHDVEWALLTQIFHMFVQPV